MVSMRSIQSSSCSTVTEGKVARKKYELKPGLSLHPSALECAKMIRSMDGVEFRKEVSTIDAEGDLGA